jgi:hypothetical protein
MKELETLGAPRVFLKPILLRSPMNAFAVWENVREYPQKNHYGMSLSRRK